MQETRPMEMIEEDARELGKIRQEFFTGPNDKAIRKGMDKRLGELPKERPVRRVKIGRNEMYPCRSGRKFKKCCIRTATAC